MTHNYELSIEIVRNEQILITVEHVYTMTEVETNKSDATADDVIKEDEKTF